MWLYTFQSSNSDPCSTQDGPEQPPNAMFEGRPTASSITTTTDNEISKQFHLFNHMQTKFTDKNTLKYVHGTSPFRSRILKSSYHTNKKHRRNVHTIFPYGSHINRKFVQYETTRRHATINFMVCFRSRSKKQTRHAKHTTLEKCTGFLFSDRASKRNTYHTEIITLSPTQPI
jgi:hypothetical protein